MLKCRVCFSGSQLQVTPVPLLWEPYHIGLLPASLLPRSCGPLPSENPVEILGLRIRDVSGGCAGPGETNGPGCGAQVSGEMLQSTQCSPVLLYIPQILTAFGKYTFIRKFAYLSSVCPTRIKKSSDSRAVLPTVVLEPSGTE